MPPGEGIQPTFAGVIHFPHVGADFRAALFRWAALPVALRRTGTLLAVLVVQALDDDLPVGSHQANLDAVSQLLFSLCDLLGRENGSRLIGEGGGVPGAVEHAPVAAMSDNLEDQRNRRPFRTVVVQPGLSQGFDFPCLLTENALSLDEALAGALRRTLRLLAKRGIDHFLQLFHGMLQAPGCGGSAYP